SAVQTFLAREEVDSRPSETQPLPAWSGLPPSVVAESAVDSPRGEFGDVVVLGQHRETYIVASDGEDLVLVDQHTAHERVRFERLLEQVAKRTVEMQMLLSPLVVSLPPALRPVLEANAESLAIVGYDVEAFGGGSLRVRAVPAILGSRDPGLAL